MAGTVEKETNFYLYKIIDKDELVYIGKSTNIDNRIEVHSVINNYFDKTCILYVEEKVYQIWLFILQMFLTSIFCQYMK